MIQPHKFTRSSLLIFPMFLLVACSSNKYAATNKIYKNQANGFAEMVKAVPPANQTVATLEPSIQSWIGSVNFGIRRPNFVIIHHTAQDSLDQTVKTFINKKAGVSAHYVVGRDGKVVQMVNDYLRANHAGVGKWGNDSDLNSSSIGIELDNNGKEPFADAQLRSLVELLAALKKRYNIPAANFIGHSDIAPRRKIDPLNFPWKVLAKKGFGLWYDEVLKMPPVDFNAELALRVIGYDVSNLASATVAFKIHFVQTDISPVLTPTDKLILYNLYTKYL